MNSRMIISENGLHPICSLYDKKAVNCMLDIENNYEYCPCRGTKMDMKNEVINNEVN